MMIKSRRLRWAGHVVRMEEGRGALKSLTGTSTGNRTLGRPKSRWGDNMKIVFKEIGINTRKWVDLAQDRNYWSALVNLALKFRVP